MTDPDGHQDSENRCGYMWRNNPDVDGSWWWYQIPVYKQTFTDYKWLSSSGSDNTSGDGSDDSDASQSDPSASSGNESAKYTPKETNVNNCTPKKKSCTIAFKKCPSKCTGYQIRYCTNKKFRNCKTKTVKGRNNLTCTLSGLKAGTTYYYQIRCYRKVGNKKICSGWSKCKSFKTKKSKYSTAEGMHYKIIKYKDKVYCGVGNRLVEVDLNTKKTKTIATTEPDYLGIEDMCVKNGYLYYYSHDGEDFTYASLYRIKLNGKNNKLLHSGKANPDHGRFLQYKIINNKIYLLVENLTKKGNFVSYTMNLDGSNKKVEAYFDNVESWSVYKRDYPSYEEYHKMCNVKGYERVEGDWEELGEYNDAYHYECSVWLKTPKGKIKVGKYSW